MGNKIKPRAQTQSTNGKRFFQAALSIARKGSLKMLLAKLNDGKQIKPRA